MKHEMFFRMSNFIKPCRLSVVHFGVSLRRATVVVVKCFWETKKCFRRLYCSTTGIVFHLYCDLERRSLCFVSCITQTTFIADTSDKYNLLTLTSTKGFDRRDC